MEASMYDLRQQFIYWIRIQSLSLWNHFICCMFWRIVIADHDLVSMIPFQTTTTGMPAFWGYLPPPYDYPYYWPVHIGSQVKTRQSQSYKFKEFAKTSKSLHMTHLLKMLNKMCKYEMDLTSIVEDTKQIWFCPQTDKVKPVFPP